MVADEKVLLLLAMAALKPPRVKVAVSAKAAAAAAEARRPRLLRWTRLSTCILSPFTAARLSRDCPLMHSPDGSNTAFLASS